MKKPYKHMTFTLKRGQDCGMKVCLPNGNLDMSHKFTKFWDYWKVAKTWITEETDIGDQKQKKMMAERRMASEKRGTSDPLSKPL